MQRVWESRMWEQKNGELCKGPQREKGTEEDLIKWLGSVEILTEDVLPSNWSSWED